MTPNAQILAIAQACGWQLGSNVSGLAWNEKERRALIVPGSAVHLTRAKMGLPCEPGTHLLPDYLQDLNAMHEAEKVLLPPYDARKRTDANQPYWAYQLELSRVTHAGDDDKGPLAIITATAAQRAEALLRTLKLWTDDK